jgi:hypothetical protein
MFEATDELIDKMVKMQWLWLEDENNQIDDFDRSAMRAALAVAVPEVVKWALREPTENEMIATADSRTNWSFEPGGDYDRARRIFAKRLASSLTAPPKDAAVEAVTKRMAELTGRILDPTQAQQIVAAVREADKGVKG